MPDVGTIAAWLAEREAAVPALRPDCAKSIVWAEEEGVQTPWSVVFIHGFSATGHEVRPLPDIVAQDLGANLFFARLAGHGQDSAAMGTATLEAWNADTEEALMVGALLGKRVIVISCSTGGTLTALALARGAKIAGAVMLSPNFGLRFKLAQAVLDMPGLRHYGEFMVGPERAFGTKSPAHAAYWTSSYPTKALYTMADTVRAAREIAYQDLTTPLTVALNDRDKVISPEMAKDVMQRWGGPVNYVPLVQTADDDKMGHIMAGDVFSPGQTAPLAAKISAWARQL